MSIWGHRDSEPQAEEAHESLAAAHDTQEPAAEHQAAEHQAAEHQAAEHQAEDHQAEEHQAEDRGARLLAGTG